MHQNQEKKAESFEEKKRYIKEKVLRRGGGQEKKPCYGDTGKRKVAGRSELKKKKNGG